MYEGGKVIGEWNDAEIAYEYKNSGAYEAYYTRNGLKSNSINFVDKNGESVCLYGGGIIVRNIRKEQSEEYNLMAYDECNMQKLEISYYDLLEKYKSAKKSLKSIDKGSDEYNACLEYLNQLKQSLNEIEEQYYDLYNAYLY